MGKMGFRDTGTDPYVYQEIAGGNSVALGLDNSDSDKLKIDVAAAAGATPSGTAEWIMTLAGERTMPRHPVFIARGNTELAVSGNGDNHFIGSVTAATEILDIGNNFFPGDGAGNGATFTAPVAGKYLFHFSLGMRFNATGGSNFIHDIFVFPGPVVVNLFVGPSTSFLPNYVGANNCLIFSGSAIVNLNAGDPVGFLFGSGVPAEMKVDDVIGFPTVETYFSGALLF